MKQRLDLKVTDLGATQLKNIALPVRVYSLEVGQPAEAKPKALASRRRSRRALRNSMMLPSPVRLTTRP